jgi:hypothetical protein
VWSIDWSSLVQDMDRERESSCECGNEPLGSIKCWELLSATQLVPTREVLSSIELLLYKGAVRSLAL